MAPLFSVCSKGLAKIIVASLRKSGVAEGLKKNKNKTA